MRSIGVAVAVWIAAAAPVMAADGQPCGEVGSRLLALQSRYRANMTQLRIAEAAVLRSASTAEDRLRTTRQYLALQRDVAKQRDILLDLYQRLVDDSCPRFDEDGLQRTRWEFERLSLAEQKFVTVLATLRDPIP